MKSIKNLKLLLIFLLLFAGSTIAQNKLPDFSKDVQAFKTADSIKTPPKHPVLLIGSSSFTKWRDVQKYFPDATILNRAFGGSTLLDLIKYHKEIVDPYNPSQILIYCGENDLAYSDSITTAIVVQRFKKLFNLISAKYKNVPIVFLSLKPSPSRAKLLPKYNIVNAEIAQFLAKHPYTQFVDVYHPMLQENGQVFKDIFLADSLHMNAKGYDIWKRILDPVIFKNH